MYGMVQWRRLKKIYSAPPFQWALGFISMLKNWYTSEFLSIWDKHQRYRQSTKNCRSEIFSMSTKYSRKCFPKRNLEKKGWNPRIGYQKSMLRHEHKIIGSYSFILLRNLWKLWKLGEIGKKSQFLDKIHQKFSSRMFEFQGKKSN